MGDRRPRTMENPRTWHVRGLLTGISGLRSVMDWDAVPSIREVSLSRAGNPVNRAFPFEHEKTPPFGGVVMPG